MSEDIAIAHVTASLSQVQSKCLLDSRDDTYLPSGSDTNDCFGFSLCMVVTSNFVGLCFIDFFIRYPLPQSVVEHHIHNVCCYFYCDCYWIYYIFQFHVNFIGTMHHYMHILCKWWRKWNCIYPKWWRKFDLKFMKICVFICLVYRYLT